MTAPGGGVQAGLNTSYQTSEIIERCGQGTSPKLLPLHGTGISTQTSPPRKKSYLGSRWRSPLKPPEMAISTRVEIVFRALHEAILCPNPSTFLRTAWISQESRSNIYPRADGRRDPIRYQLRLHRFIHIIREKLRDDWLQWVTVAGREIEALLSSYPPPPPSKKNVSVYEGLL